MGRGVALAATGARTWVTSTRHFPATRCAYVWSVRVTPGVVVATGVPDAGPSAHDVLADACAAGTIATASRTAASRARTDSTVATGPVNRPRVPRVPRWSTP
jgi:hypothetical protein